MNAGDICLLAGVADRMVGIAPLSLYRLLIFFKALLNLLHTQPRGRCPDSCHQSSSKDPPPIVNRVFPLGLVAVCPKYDLKGHVGGVTMLNVNLLLRIFQVHLLTFWAYTRHLFETIPSPNVSSTSRVYPETTTRAYPPDLNVRAQAIPMKAATVHSKRLGLGPKIAFDRHEASLHGDYQKHHKTCYPRIFSLY